MQVKNFDQNLEDFIKNLQTPTRMKVVKTTDLLEQFSNHLRMPYSKSLGGGLFELRIRGQQEVRIFYTFYDNNAVLLHGCIKKTQKTPAKELRIAMTKLKSLTNR